MVCIKCGGDGKISDPAPFREEPKPQKVCNECNGSGYISSLRGPKQEGSLANLTVTTSAWLDKNVIR
jgi:DnaJ-class molecular chaperone